MIRSIPIATMRKVWDKQSGLTKQEKDIKRFGSIRYGRNQRHLQPTNKPFQPMKSTDFKVKMHKTPKMRKNILRVETTNITYQSEFSKTKNNLEVILDFENIQYPSGKFSRRLGIYSINIVNINLLGNRKEKEGILSLTTIGDILDIIIKSEEETMFTDEIQLQRCYKGFTVELKNNFVIANYKN